jgi:hypothetical protein
MRLLTRSDFDGLACAVLLKEVESIDSIEFHASEAARNEDMHFKGRFAVAPSAARVVYDYYVLQGRGEKLSKYNTMLTEVDKSDAAMLEPDDVTDPKGWILLSYLMDSRTGLGKIQDYQISNRDLMMKMVDWMSHKSPEEILEMPDIKERVAKYYKEESAFRAALEKHSKQDGNVVITDFRNLDTVVGNRFLIYTLFPKTNISIRLIDGKNKEFCSLAVGHSIFNRTSRSDVGALMAKYGGGGHRGAGTCQLPYSEVDKKLAEMVVAMKKDG